MESFPITELYVPASQMAILLIINTLALLFGRMRLALLTTYIFTLYWGYVLNDGYMVGATSEDIGIYTFIYFGFGLLVIIFALMGFVGQQNR